MRGSLKSLVALAAVVLLLAVVPAPAQEPHAEPQETAGQEIEHAIDEHIEEEEHGETEWYVYPARWTNFILLVGLLYWMLVLPPQPIQDIFTFPGLKVILRERAQAIIDARDLAARQGEEAAALLTASEERLAKIEDEVKELVAVARTDAQRESERAEVEGEEQARKVLEVAERELGSERRAAQRQLRGFVADLAVSMAQTNLEKHLSADDQNRLIRDYLSRLGGSVA